MKPQDAATAAGIISSNGDTVQAVYTDSSPADYIKITRVVPTTGHVCVCVWVCVCVRALTRLHSICLRIPYDIFEYTKSIVEAKLIERGNY